MSALRLRTLGAVVFAAAFVCIGASTPAPATAASQTSNLDFWWDKYGIDAAHSEGITGQGVKVAVLEGQINPDLPVFEGRDLRIADTPVCRDHPSMTSVNPDKGTRHGTTMAALIIGNGSGPGQIRGVAPDAELTFYGYGPGGRVCETDTDRDMGLTAWGYGVKLAVDDGAKVIFTSVGGEGNENDAPAIAYALAKGAVLVTASANPSGAKEFGVYIDNDQGSMNGVVSTAAIDRDGSLQKSEDGAPWVIPQTTVVAGGTRFPEVGTDAGWDQSGTATGSSYASPIVAGMLALAAQKYPEATGNQLVQALIATTNGQEHTPSRTDDGYGYGAAWLTTLLAANPAKFPDETPLMGKSGGFPTTEQIEAARTGGFVAPPERGRSFDQYADDPVSSGPDLSLLVVWGVIGFLVLVVVAVLVTVLIVVTQRRKSAKVISS